MSRLLCLTIATGAALGIASLASAAERLWTNPAGGGFESSGNWSGGAAPVVGDSGRFSLGSLTYFVTLFDDYDVGRVLVSSDNVTLLLGGATLTCLHSVNEDEASLVVGDTMGSSASLTVNQGALQSIYASVGDSGGFGTLTIDGSNTSWLNSSRIAIGNSGTGTLRITNSADVLNGPAFIGKYARSDGEVIVNGVGSTWDTEAGLAVGSSGLGALTVESGGRAEANLVFVGRFETGDGALTTDGAGSLFKSFGTMNIGVEGVGIVTALNGSAIEATAINIGTAETGLGELVVNTPFGTVSASLEINVGQAGEGLLSVERGTLTSPVVRVGVGASANGLATVRFGAILQSSDVAVGTGGALTGDGQVSGPVTSSGTVQPGFPVGTLTVTGAYNQASGIGGNLAIDVEGLTKGSTHDWLLVNGNATLGGALTVNFGSGVPLADGDVIEFLNAASVSGTFPLVQYNNLPLGLNASVEYTPTAVRVRINGNSSDLNGDGVVDGMDLAELLSFWGPCVGDCPPDFNDDGVVDGMDLALILASWTI